MKNKLLFILIIISVGCKEPTVSKQQTDYVFDNFGTRLKIIEIDSCEYFYLRVDRGASLTHKGNCKNHKK